MSTSSDDSLVGLILFGLALAIIIPLAFVSCGEHYSSGARTGVITKLSHKGLMSKTWEGEMNLGGMVASGDGKSMVVNAWQFTVESDGLIDTINQAMASGKRVTLHYHQWLKRPIMRTDTGYMVDAVQAEGVSEAVGH